MLEKVLTYLHNWFLAECHVGTWEVKGGSLDLPFLQDGQYYRILGSVFNDGLHKHPADDLVDENPFSGEIWGLAIPLEIVAIADEIKEWNDKNGSVADSPFNSESFGGYSYSKGSSSTAGDGGLALTGWQAAFASRLAPWKRLYE